MMFTIRSFSPEIKFSLHQMNQFRPVQIRFTCLVYNKYTNSFDIRIKNLLRYHKNQENANFSNNKVWL